MIKYINKLKEIETLVEQSTGDVLLEDKATDIYSITNELMSDIKSIGKSIEQNSKMVSLLEFLLENNLCTKKGNELIEHILNNK